VCPAQLQLAGMPPAPRCDPCPRHVPFTLRGRGGGPAETTIENNNATLWAFVKPQGTVLEWIRSVVATRLAASGQQWCDLFKRYNRHVFRWQSLAGILDVLLAVFDMWLGMLAVFVCSGTYNNMWHVVDMKLFTPGQPLQPNLLWVLEQMPGPFVVAADMTSKLSSAGYWASYNRVYNTTLFSVSNQTALVRAFGDHYSWADTARAQVGRAAVGGWVGGGWVCV
jgi:hypothetical protein